MDCQAEAARALKDVAAIERLLREAHEKHRALNDLAVAGDDGLEAAVRQMEEVGAEMRERFEQKRPKAAEAVSDAEGRERLLSALAQLRRERKALDDVG